MRKYKNIIQKQKFEISSPTWNDNFELSDTELLNIQDYFAQNINKHDKFTDNYPILIYIIKTENKITFIYKAGCYLQLLTAETMKSLGRTEIQTNKENNR